MIKGVNKRIVEVSFPESEYFEKAVVFIRTDCPEINSPCLTDEAGVQIMELEGRLGKIRSDRGRLKKKIRFYHAAELVYRVSVVICAAAILCMVILN